MARSGIGYYYDKAGLSTGDLQFYYDFSTSGNSGSSLVSKNFSLVGNTGSFWSSSGSGFFSGTVLGITNLDLDESKFTSIIINNKTTSGKAILASSLTSGVGGISGFVLGFNDANKLYLTSYDSGLSSYITNTSSFQIGRQNGFSISKFNNTFTIGKFNFFERELYTETLQFPLDCNTNFSSISFGGGTGLPSNINNDYFSGYIDEILLTNQNLQEDTIEMLFKGFYKEEPNLEYTLVEESDSYRYSNLNNVTSPIWEELQSGALDYIRTNIFNTTGIGTIRATNSGTIVNGTGYVSGNLSGTVSLQTGYYETTTGSGITGYTTSGQVASASGITGYVDIDLYPITVFSSGNIYQLSAQSGISGITSWSSVFSGPLYETIVTTGFVADSISSDYLINFSYVITGLSGNATYLHISDYSNNGDDNIVISHDLTYTGMGATFRAFKNTQLRYQYTYVENDDDTNYINQFTMDGVVLLGPIKSGDILELIYQNYTGVNNYNHDCEHSLASGLFSYTGSIDSDDTLLFINGVYQHPNRLYEDVYLTTGVDILYSGSESWIVASTFGGDYDITGGYFYTENKYDRNDVSFFDNIPFLNIIKNKQNVTGLSEFVSGYNLASGSSGYANSMFLINGVKLISGTDYQYNTGESSYELSNNNYSGVTGVLFAVTLSGLNNISSINDETGISNIITGTIPENSSLLFYNGLRQNLNIDYIETSSLDYIYNLTGFYEFEGQLILNK